MKRNVDLLRDILLKIEEAPYQGTGGFSVPKMSVYNQEEVQHHIGLLVEARYVQAQGLSRLDESDWTWTINGLTLRGHDFLDEARDQKRWNQAKTVIRERGGSLTFDILKVVLTQLTRQAVGL